MIHTSLVQVSNILPTVDNWFYDKTVQTIARIMFDNCKTSSVQPEDQLLILNSVLDTLFGSNSLKFYCYYKNLAMNVICQVVLQPIFGF